MTLSPSLSRVVEDELARAPVLLQQALEAVLEALGPPAFDERQLRTQLQQAFASHRSALVLRFVEALREHALGRPAIEPRPTGKRLPLSLVDEAEVAAEVEQARAAEAISSVAESELREFAAYIAALMGDLNMSRTENPLRPEVYARAAWAGLQVLPLSRGHQLALMRRLAMPLAHGVRLAYSAACTRLEDEGVEPAAYRTLILPAGTRSEPACERHGASADLARLRDTLAAPLDVPAAAARPGSPARRGAAAPASADSQLAAVLGRLFRGIVADPSLSAPVRTLLAPLEASAVRVGRTDPSLLLDHEHPVWRFIDRLAFDVEVVFTDELGREHLARYAPRLIDHMAHSPAHDAALYRWGLERIAACEHHLIEQRQLALGDRINALRAIEGRIGFPDAPRPSDAGALDAATLDTVPASLLAATAHDESTKSSQAQRWLLQRQSGDTLRLFLQGRWISAQALWCSDLGELWLLHELPGGEPWAVHRGALLRLRAEGLAEVLEPRSLLQGAAEQMLQQLGAPRADAAPGTPTLTA